MRAQSNCVPIAAPTDARAPAKSQPGKAMRRPESVPNVVTTNGPMNIPAGRCSTRPKPRPTSPRMGIATRCHA